MCSEHTRRIGRAAPLLIGAALTSGCVLYTLESEPIRHDLCVTRSPVYSDQAGGARHIAVGTTHLFALGEFEHGSTTQDSSPSCLWSDPELTGARALPGGSAEVTVWRDGASVYVEAHAPGDFTLEVTEAHGRVFTRELAAVAADGVFTNVNGAAGDPSAPTILLEQGRFRFGRLHVFEERPMLGQRRIDNGVWTAPLPGARDFVRVGRVVAPPGTYTVSDGPGEPDQGATTYEVVTPDAVDHVGLCGLGEGACLGSGDEIPTEWFRGDELVLRLDARTADGEPVVGDRVDAYPMSTPSGWQRDPGGSFNPRVLRLSAERERARDGWLRVTAFGRTIAVRLIPPT
jgi:hypothetical protein